MNAIEKKQFFAKCSVKDCTNAATHRVKTGVKFCDECYLEQENDPEPDPRVPKSILDDPWNNNSIQFPRLLSEIDSTIEFTDTQKETLCSLMDLSWDEISEIFTRAVVEFDTIKGQIVGRKNLLGRKK